MDHDLLKMPKLGQMVIYKPTANDGIGMYACPAVVTTVFDKTTVSLTAFPNGFPPFQVSKAVRGVDLAGEYTKDHNSVSPGTWVFG